MKNIAWLGAVVVLFAAIIIVGFDAREAEKRARRPVIESTNNGTGYLFASAPPVLHLGETSPIVERALQRIKRRLTKAKSRIPALSEVENARIENFRFHYSKGTARTNKHDPPHLDPPDACLLEIVTRYASKYDNNMHAQLAPTKTYDLGNDHFEYTVWLIAASSGSDEIQTIIEQEMDIAAKLLQKAGGPIDLFWPFW
ncbi:MAG: hypothetical protein HZA88_19175 [Verrucomicrobia bacterium]|nr:hypothetical protein [Verrucomicrobiota bacterium]